MGADYRRRQRIKSGFAVPPTVAQAFDMRQNGAACTKTPRDSFANHRHF
jgi:hypothetical protein